MKKIKSLHYSALRLTLDITQLDFKTTQKIKPINGFIGQERALDALKFGISISKKGYNIYAMGPPGIGKHSFITTLLNDHVNRLPTPPDWCYIYNFDVPEKPIALQLPAGKGLILLQDMKSLIEELGQTIISVFESDEYHIGIKKINAYFKLKRAKRKKIKKISEHKIPYLYKERHEKEKSLKIKLLTSMVDPIFHKIKKKYAKFDDVIRYLDKVESHFIDNASDYLIEDSKTGLLNFPLDNPDLVKYKINLMVDNSQLKGAPVIFEETPHYSNLISRVEYTTRDGVLVTNFNLIRTGSLHRANGGFLIIESRKLIKKNHDAWEALKSAIYSQKIKIEPDPQMENSIKTISLDPEPIPLNVKIILIGDRNTYYHLCQNDQDFTKLFKVPVDFDEHILRNHKNILLYARLIASIVNEEKLRTFHMSAIGAIIDQSTRLAEDIEKLSTYFHVIKDLTLEADYWAGHHNKKIVEAEHVQKAIQAQYDRMDRTRNLYYEDIQRNFIIIDTENKVTGQINCLSVRKVGNFSYGHPTRVTARVRAGKGNLIDIQREIKMAGPMHSKAGLIIANFLASHFNAEQLFSLSASISFEQIYCWTDGDSASVGELCALLSALAEVPIKQCFAITGSIDQYGDVQAVGGLNEKIEGFFDICQAKGLTGKQGVLIPAVNVKNLMLREEVVFAAKQNQFSIYLIETVDEAMEILTGKSVRHIYEKVEKRLQQFLESRMRKLLK